MSNERKNPADDPLVADAYSALAQEQTPEHLNKRVLRMAAREGRTPYSRARSWLRPAAWAATIGLSFAIVLELTRLPQIEPEPVSMDAFTPKDMSVLREADERARAQSGANQVPVVPPAIPRTDAAAAPDNDVSARRMTADENIPASSASADQDEGERISAKRRAVESTAGAASFAVATEEKAQATGFACASKVRESAETWLGCIEQLRESGQEALADREYDEFKRIFPNFADIDTDK